MNHATTTLTLTALQSSRRVTGSSCPETYGVVGTDRVRRGKVLPRGRNRFSTGSCVRKPGSTIASRA